jgi:high-affinity Fe2+/Pb2+ permease
MESSDAARSRVAVLLAATAPGALVLWLIVSTSGLSFGVFPTVVMGVVVMGAITMSGSHVQDYEASREGSAATRVPTGLSPFTIGYLSFHASRARWPKSLVVAGVIGPLAALGTLWTVFLVMAFVGPA